MREVAQSSLLTSVSGQSLSERLNIESLCPFGEQAKPESKHRELCSAALVIFTQLTAL